MTQEEFRSRPEGLGTRKHSRLLVKVTGRAFTGTDHGLLRLVLGPWSPVPKCEAPGAPIHWKNTLPWYLGPAAKVRILCYKNLPPFRHDPSLRNHV